jgi:citronellol/citronellal dehydrogenase
MISKWGMTIGAIGLSEELKGNNIGVNTLWPMTPIESFAVKNNNLGDKKIWRKSDIIVDSVLHMINEDPTIFTGNQLIDETYLRNKGHHNFEKYQCELGYEPPKLTDINHLFKSSL